MIGIAAPAGRASACVLLFIATGVTCGSTDAVAVDKAKNNAISRQRETADRIHLLRDCLYIYSEKHGRNAPSLELALHDLYPTKKGDALQDSWGRPFVFYRTQDDYFLASFGRDGAPDAGRSNETTEDCDIVMISGVFARLPIGVSE